MPKLATYIATDSVKAADNLCDWLFKQIGGSRPDRDLRGVLGATAEVQRSKGCQQALAQNPGIKVVATQAANWDETQAYKATQNMLQANPGIKAIFGESDAMGLGAAKRRQGRRTQDRRRRHRWLSHHDCWNQAGPDSGYRGADPRQDGAARGDERRPDSEWSGSQVPELQYQDTTLVTSTNVNSVNPVDFYGPNVK